MALKSKCIAVLAAILFVSHVQAADGSELRSCAGNPDHQTARSAELKKIEEQDQADRKLPFEQIDWNEVNRRDLERRARVALIFAEGCITSAKDLGYAALVYQHGDAPGHFYQAFQWAAQSVKLGDETQRWLTAAALDRYLKSIGHKQLFGSQFSKDDQGLWCIEPIEATFPPGKRFEYTRKTLREGTAVFLEFYESDQKVDEVRDCAGEKHNTPEGFVPGFW